MPEPWNAAPFVYCDHCERETRVDDVSQLVVGAELACSFCGATLRVAEVQDVRHTRCVVVRLPPGASFDDDALTPVETPALKRTT